MVVREMRVTGFIEMDEAQLVSVVIDYEQKNILRLKYPIEIDTQERTFFYFLNNIPIPITDALQRN